MEDKEEKQYKNFIPTEEFKKAQEELTKNMFSRMMQEGLGGYGLPFTNLTKLHEPVEQDDETLHNTL